MNFHNQERQEFYGRCVLCKERGDKKTNVTGEEMDENENRQ